MVHGTDRKPLDTIAPCHSSIATGPVIASEVLPLVKSVGDGEEFFVDAQSLDTDVRMQHEFVKLVIFNYQYWYGENHGRCIVS